MGLIKEAIADVTQIQGLVHERNRMANVIEKLEYAFQHGSVADMPEVFAIIRSVHEGSSLMDAVEAMYGSK